MYVWDLRQISSFMYNYIPSSGNLWFILTSIIYTAIHTFFQPSLLKPASRYHAIPLKSHVLIWATPIQKDSGGLRWLPKVGVNIENSFRCYINLANRMCEWVHILSSLGLAILHGFILLKELKINDCYSWNSPENSYYTYVQGGRPDLYAMNYRWAIPTLRISEFPLHAENISKHDLYPRHDACLHSYSSNSLFLLLEKLVK